MEAAPPKYECKTSESKAHSWSEQSSVIYFVARDMHSSLVPWSLIRKSIITFPEIPFGCYPHVLLESSGVSRRLYYNTKDEVKANFRRMLEELEERVKLE